jgi:Uma2 family endonuclease
MGTRAGRGRAGGGYSTNPSCISAKTCSFRIWPGGGSSGWPLVPDVTACRESPDWVCEVISPTTGYLDRTRKMPVYARAAVSHLWLIDPSTRTLEAYRLDGDRWVVVATHGRSATVRVEPFADLDLDLHRLWGEA